MFAHMLVLGLLLLAPATAFAQATAARETKPVKMVVLGDSLSAGLGLSAPAAFPARLQKALQAKGIEVDMINAGVSGDTTFGRPRPARLVGAGGNPGRDCRTRRQ